MEVEKGGQLCLLTIGRLGQLCNQFEVLAVLVHDQSNRRTVSNTSTFSFVLCPLGLGSTDFLCFASDGLHERLGFLVDIELAVVRFDAYGLVDVSVNDFPVFAFQFGPRVFKESGHYFVVGSYISNILQLEHKPMSVKSNFCSMGLFGSNFVHAKKES